MCKYPQWIWRNNLIPHRRDMLPKFTPPNSSIPIPPRRLSWIIGVPDMLLGFLLGAPMAYSAIRGPRLPIIRRKFANLTSLNSRLNRQRLSPMWFIHENKSVKYPPTRRILRAKIPLLALGNKIPIIQTHIVILLPTYPSAHIIAYWSFSPSSVSSSTSRRRFRIGSYSDNSSWKVSHSPSFRLCRFIALADVVISSQ